MKPDDADALGSDAFPDDADDFFGAVAAEAGALVSEKIEREKREKAERELASFEYETHADGTYTLTSVMRDEVTAKASQLARRAADAAASETDDLAARGEKLRLAADELDAYVGLIDRL